MNYHAKQILRGTSYVLRNGYEIYSSYAKLRFYLGAVLFVSGIFF